MPISHQDLDGIRSTTRDRDEGKGPSGLKIFYTAAVVLILLVGLGYLASISAEDNAGKNDEYNFGEFDGDERENLIGEWRLVERDGVEPSYEGYFIFYADNTYNYEVDHYRNQTFIESGNWMIEEEENLLTLYEKDPDDEYPIYYSFSEDGDELILEGVPSEWNMILEKMS